MSILAAPYWQNAANNCFARKSQAVGWIDMCYQLNRTINDEDASYDYFSLDNWATMKSYPNYGLDLGYVSAVRLSGTSTQYWVKWAPMDDLTTSQCYTSSIGFTVLGVGASFGVTICPNKWDVTKYADAGHFKNQWNGWAPCRTASMGRPTTDRITDQDQWRTEIRRHPRRTRRNLLLLLESETTERGDPKMTRIHGWVLDSLARLRVGSACLPVIAIATAACSASPSPPPAPTVDVVGLISGVEVSQAVVRYRLADGRIWEALPGTYRTIRPGASGGNLLIAGADAQGQFIATFYRQDDLPADCYVENAEGVERGAYIEARGVMWAKAADFRSDVPVPANGQTYPSGTRFCFDSNGRLALTLAP